MNKCKCNDRDPLLCHECEESDGICYCRCHDETPHKFVGVGAGELGMSKCGQCGHLERDLIHSLKFREEKQWGDYGTAAGERYGAAIK